jgi:hypothetical protein
VTRRGVVVALATVAASFATEAQERERESLSASGTVSTGLAFKQRPYSIALYLQDDDSAQKGLIGYKDLTVHYRGRSVTLTAKEIMDALEERPPSAPQESCKVGQTKIIDGQVYSCVQPRRAGR